jgi:hypothetical protein
LYVTGKADGRNLNDEFALGFFYDERVNKHVLEERERETKMYKS